MLEAIVQSGAEAVIAAGGLDTARPIDRVPEVGVGYAMRPRLEALLVRDEPGTTVEWEVSYARIAQELGLYHHGLTAQIGGHRADLAVYDPDRRPVAVVEIKKFAEGHKVDPILHDLNRVLSIADDIDLNSFVGVMVCETTRPLVQRQDALQHGIGRACFFGEAVNVGGPRPWKWCFAAASRL